VILLIGILFLAFSFPQKVRAGTPPSLMFSPVEVTTNLGDNFTLDVNIDTGGQKVGGAGAQIFYDPLFLQAVSIENGTIFSDYPSSDFDNNQGKIIISGIVSPITNLYSGSGLFAKVTFKSVNSGVSSVKFNFVPGSTTDSNIAVVSGSGDILSEVNQANITIQTGVVTAPAGVPPVSILDSILNNSFVKKVMGIFGYSGQPVSHLNQQQPISANSFTSENPSETRLVTISIVIFSIIFIALVAFILFRIMKRKKAKNIEEVKFHVVQ